MPPSFGGTCAANARTAALLFLLGLSIAALPLSAAHAAADASSVSSTIPLSLGFSPSSLSPVSEGVPVYTAGDTIWADSGYTSPVSLSLQSPGTTVPAVNLVVSPSAITPVYTFKANDADGLWNITLSSQGKVSVVPVRFVNLADHQVSVGPFDYAIDGGDLSISAQANLGDSYDQEVCAAGDTGLALTLPTEMRETGNMTLSPGKTGLGLTINGQVNESFSFWFELYHPFSLEVTSANSLVVDNLLSAQTAPVTVSPTPFTNSTEKVNATVTWNTPIRQGRYDMRAYFENSTGSLDVVQQSLLVLGPASWVSLSGSCPPQTVQSQDISYSASLAGGQATWPRTIYFMYRTFGVEAVQSYSVDANLSSVNFVASPWDQAIPDLQVNVSPVPGLLSSGEAGGSLFVLSSGYPTQVSYSLGIGGSHALFQGTVTLHGRYTTQTEEVSLAKLTVQVLGAQGSPSTLKVSGPQGISVAAGLTGDNQTSVLLLPTGSYTVAASQGANTQSAQVALTDGDASSLALNFSTFVTFESILIITAAIAVVANVAVWYFRSRGLGSKLASPKGSK